MNSNLKCLGQIISECQQWVSSAICKTRWRLGHCMGLHFRQRSWGSWQNWWIMKTETEHQILIHLTSKEELWMTFQKPAELLLMILINRVQALLKTFKLYFYLSNVFFFFFACFNKSSSPFPIFLANSKEMGVAQDFYTVLSVSMNMKYACYHEFMNDTVPFSYSLYIPGNLYHWTFLFSPPRCPIHFSLLPPGGSPWLPSDNRKRQLRSATRSPDWLWEACTN